ncbi:ABC transporter permease [Microbacterium sp. 1.5R]|uniref:ABC transporter permease n=1 Tax=Microbacterium sp. 1.5R TaxID=1916917 RepID=UPI0011A64E7E|nr:ABC transporter permease [Microbacterium sp. 1.5R]
MLNVIGRRLLIVIPMLFVVATLTFLLVNLIPGDPVTIILGPDATAEQYDALRDTLGLNRPLIERYGDWVAHAVRGDLGESIITGRSVVGTIGERFAVTMSIAVGAIIVTATIGILLGLVSALRGGWLGRAAQVVSVLGVSLPSFWLGILLVLVFAINLAVLPATGYVQFTDSPAEWLRSLVLPVITIAIAGVAAIARQTRSAMNEALAKDYVRTLLASGTPRGTIVLKHALRNASIPVVTSLGFQFIALFGGAFIIEQVFSIPGMGQLTISAVNNHDIPVIQGVVLASAALVIVVNLLVDLLYAVLNPKVRH